MNENNRNEKVSGEIGTNRKSTVKHKGKTVKKNYKVKEQKLQSQKEKKQAENANERGEYHGNDCLYYNYH